MLGKLTHQYGERLAAVERFHLKSLESRADTTYLEQISHGQRVENLEHGQFGQREDVHCDSLLATRLILTNLNSLWLNSSNSSNIYLRLMELYSRIVQHNYWPNSLLMKALNLI